MVLRVDHAIDLMIHSYHLLSERIMSLLDTRASRVEKSIGIGKPIRCRVWYGVVWYLKTIS